MSKWYLLPNNNNFFTTNHGVKTIPFTFKRSVTFINLDQWSEVISCNFTYMEEAISGKFIDALLKIKPSHFRGHNLVKEFIRFLASILEKGDYVSPPASEYVYVYFKHAAALNKFILHIDQLNAWMKKNIFSDDILLEFKNMAAYCCRSNRSDFSALQTVHLLPLANNACNSAWHGTRLAADIMTMLQQAKGGKLDDIQYKKIKSLVTQTEGMNATVAMKGYAVRNDGYVLPPFEYAFPETVYVPGFYFDKDPDLEIIFSPLTFAVRHCENDLRLIKLLLKYCGDPTQRMLDAWEYSAFDYALDSRNKPVIDLIRDVLERIEHPLALTVNRIHTEAKNGELVTVIDWQRKDDPENKVVDTVTSKLKKSVSFAELQTILEMSAQAFELPDDAESTLLSGSLIQDIYGNNRFIEIIRNQSGEMIGFTIYELMVRDHGKLLVWYCSLAYITPESRPENKKPGMMQLLNWRHAFALQLTCPGSVIQLAFLSIHPNSYKFVHSAEAYYPHYPMYQPQHLVEHMPDLLDAIEHGLHLRLQHENMTCYVTHQFKVKEKSRSRNNFFSDFFYECMLDQTDKQSAWKAAPIVIPIADVPYFAFAALCGQMRINAETHLSTLALALREILGELLPIDVNKQFQLQCFRQYDLLFWKNISAPSRSINLPSLCKMRAKL